MKNYHVRFGTIGKLIAQILFREIPARGSAPRGPEMRFQDVPREIVAEHLQKMREAVGRASPSDGV